MPLLTLTGARVTFETCLGNMVNGGKQATAAKDLARADLLGLLRQQAAYVQSIAGGDLPLLLSSGFEAVNTNRAQVQLEKPVIDLIDNPMSTQLGLRLQPVYTAAAYEVRVKYGANGWEAVGVFTRPALSSLQAGHRERSMTCRRGRSAAAPATAIGAIQSRTWQCEPNHV